ncbi:MAG: preprotein translocase subunit SecG [Acidobacteria bacterium]|nr:preprotein translocase subunit SecG [Acidobacteriota bacterium]
MAFYLILALHLFVSLILIAVVLLQSGKGADLAGAFGGGGSQTAFGARGAATFLSKLTTACAVIFMITSLALAILYNRQASSVVERVRYPSAQPAAPQSQGPGQQQAQPGQPQPTKK